MNKFLTNFNSLVRLPKIGFFYLRVLIKRKNKVIFFSGLAAILIVIMFVNFHSVFARKQVIYEGVIGSYTEGDLPDVVTKLLSTGLVTITSDSSPKPNLANDWQVNDQATEYTFNLKDGLVWSNGEKLKAQDLDIVIPDATEEVLNDRTIKFKLKDSFSPFPSFLSQPIFKTNSNHLGIGPYQVTRVKKDQIFMKDLSLTSASKDLPDIVIKFYPSEKIADDALELGEIQIILGVSNFNNFNNDETVARFSKTNLDQMVTIFYNTKDPVLSDENFRLALSYAAPSIPNQFEAKTSISPYSWAFNPDVKDYLNNPQSAKASLNKVEKGGDSTITLTTTTNLADVGLQVVNSWNKQGIKAILRVESGIPQNFQALLIAHSIPADPDQYSLWHSTQSTNISKYSDSRVSPRIDKDLEDGRKIVDVGVRKARYQDFQKVLLDHAPATFLYFPKYNVIYRKKIEQPLKKVLKLQLP